MEVKVNIKIKLDKGKIIELDNEDAKNLFFQLKNFYEKEKEFISVPYNPYPYHIYPWNNPVIYTVSNNRNATTDTVIYSSDKIQASYSVS